MFTAENEDVLVQFKALCEQYPRENAVALWEMAGGKFEAAQQSVHLTALRRAQIVGAVGWVIALIFYAVIIGGR